VDVASVWEGSRLAGESAAAVTLASTFAAVGTFAGLSRHLHGAVQGTQRNDADPCRDLLGALVPTAREAPAKTRRAADRGWHTGLNVRRTPAWDVWKRVTHHVSWLFRDLRVI